uniref:F-box protein PP2-B8 n=1 Tax=Elaeis guineensis var. tenera TaxID=51953 RepID=A0A8N4EY34_ELAGV|nr:putative F-box protein PP2-B8 [Elaeis guineensis]
MVEHKIEMVIEEAMRVEVEGDYSMVMVPKEAYTAYLVFKLASESNGLDHPPQLASVRLGAYASEIDICLQDDDNEDDDDSDDDASEEGWQQQRQCLRDDGWMEIKLGEFYNDEGNDGDVEIRLTETKALHWKNGLIIQGLEVRPKI